MSSSGNRSGSGGVTSPFGAFGGRGFGDGFGGGGGGTRRAD